MAEVRINTTGKLSLFDADDSHAASIVAGTVTANENVMSLATAGVTFNVPTITLGDATAEDTKLVFDGNAVDYRMGLDDSADTLEIGIGSTHATTAQISLNATGFVFNEQSSDYDFRVESDDDQYMMFIDGNNNRLFIGEGNGTTTGQGNRVQIYGTDSQKAGLQIGVGVADASPAHLELYKSRNTTQGSYTIVQADDKLGRIIFRGDDGTDLNSPAASIEAAVSGTPGSNDMPGRLMFFTTPDGSASLSERMRIHSDGVVSIPGGVELGSALDNTAANILDDYEEGTWTPVWGSTGSYSGQAYDTQTGYYTKVGRLVTLHMHMDLSDAGTVGDFSTVFGLPFTPAASSVGAVNISIANVTYPADHIPTATWYTGGSTRIYLLMCDGGAQDQVVSSTVGDDGRLYITATFLV